MRILVCGDRNWIDRKAIRNFIEGLSEDSVIIHGDARGADRIAGDEAEKAGLEVISVPARWAVYGKGAGPIRNTQMLGLKPDLVVAFHERIGESKGTRDMVSKARAEGVQIRIIGGVRG